MILSQKLVIHALSKQYHYRKLSQKLNIIKNKVIEKDESKLIRNIGILAHIDAGKTTTTERMLFFSGKISQMGEVHHGNTVTDFMDQERERGITITSASVTFQWKNHKINLLDTPGHIDFTLEVEHTLNVMDGAVIILDGSAGVEAQTITVWKQADRFQIPRIIYVNKMDRPQSDLFKCKDTITNQFNVTPLILQLPVYNDANVFKGVVDLVNLKKYEWNGDISTSDFSQKILDSNDGKLWENSIRARINLTETLADLDDKIAEMIITDEKKLETVSGSDLRDSIRKVTLKHKGIPVLCGSSYKNVGVQCLLDAIIYYLPSPICGQSGEIVRWFRNNLCAKSFKVRHVEHKGPITFFRIYSGNMHKGQKIYNISNKKIDHCDKLYVAYADDYEEVPEIGVGNIAAVTGLKNTGVGELVTSSSNIFSSAQEVYSSTTKKDLKEALSAGVLVPDPVFFCSVEAPSLREQTALEKALSELEREDPSLKVTVNSETGQTVLGGMGELHLDVIKERIRKEYKVDVNLGPLQIAYRETLIEPVKESFYLKHQIGNSQQSVSITLSVLKSTSEEKEKLLLDRSSECVQNISSIFPKHLLAVKNGVEAALGTGPKLFCPVVNVSVMLHWLDVGRGTSDSIIKSATIQCIKKALAKSGTKLLEPLMDIEIVCNETQMEKIMNNLARRRAEILNTETRGCETIVRGLVPLSELLGYATELRILTSGKANFSMKLHSFREMNGEEEEKAIKSVTGF